MVAGQRLMQAASDIFLGWQRIEAGLDGSERDFYVRQLRDWKGSADIETMARAACGSTASCAAGRWPGRTPAPATGSPSPPTWAARDVFDQAIAEFAEAYADQNERDHAALVDAVAAGRITAEPDL